VILAHAERFKLTLGRHKVCLGVVLRILSLLQRAEREGAMSVKVLGADVCLIRQKLVILGF
jgi:hypothetical protein